MIRVLHVVGVMNRGGAEVLLMNFLRNKPTDLSFDFLVNYKKNEGIKQGDFDLEIIQSGSIIAHIPTQWDLGYLNYKKKFGEIVDKLPYKPDIVHIHLNAKSGIIAWAAKKNGIKNVIVHSHANLKFRGSFISIMVRNLETFFQKFLITQYSDYYWGCSEEAINSLFNQKKLTQSNTSIINNAVDLLAFESISNEQIEQFKQKHQYNSSKLIFGNVGRIVAHKNVMFVLKILKVLNEKGFDFKFVFAGRIDDSAYMNSILEKAKEYNIFDKFVVLGLQENVALVMKTFDIFVSPALREGLGIVAIEAQAAGVPSVLYKGFPKVVDMQLGLVTFLDDFDVNKWVEAILKVKPKIEDKKIIRKGIEISGYEIKTQSQMLLEKYNKIISNNGRSL